MNKIKLQKIIVSDRWHLSHAELFYLGNQNFKNINTGTVVVIKIN